MHGVEPGLPLMATAGVASQLFQLRGHLHVHFDSAPHKPNPTPPLRHAHGFCLGRPIQHLHCPIDGSCSLLRGLVLAGRW
jgi:hypothetical protein|eukprot:SAG25_NODE_1075_length_4106_cov_2.392313_2_plen_80_part_00